LGGKVDRVPVTSVAGCGGTVCVDMENAVDVYFPEAHKNAEKMARLAVASYELSGLECVRVPFDFVVEPEALGCDIRWYDGPDKVPMTVGTHYEGPEALKSPENLLASGRIPVVLDAIRILRKEVGDFLPIASLALGPFTLASELAGAEKILRWVLKKPENVKSFVDFATGIVIDYAKAQYRAGSDIVVIGEPMASGGVLTAEMFRAIVKPSLAKVADSLGGIRVLHVCGFADKIIVDLADTGFDGLSVEESVDIARIKPMAHGVKILGNVSSKKTLFRGSAEAVKEEAKRALEAGVDLLEPGCGISPVTPLAHVKALVEAGKEYVPKE